MEEDTGKLTHVGASGRINAANHALVDYNRSGVPLVEIVSEPDIRTSAQAWAYASDLRGILMATGASDGRMEEGSMRVDANVSVRPGARPSSARAVRSRTSTRCARSVRAIEYEAARQISLLESGERIVQETRHWDESAGRTDSMRSKEEANDYRYFPEPDLVPLAPDEAWRERVRAGPGPMPADRRAELAAALGGDPTEAEIDQIRAVVDLGLDGLVTEAVGGGRADRAGPGPDGQRGGGPRWRRRPGLAPVVFAALLAMEAGGQLSATQSKTVLGALLERGGDPAALAQEMGFEALGSDTLAAVLDEIIAAHPEAWACDVGGEDKMTGIFTGPVMKATSGKANGKEVAAELLRRRG